MNERLLGRPSLLKLVATLATVGVFAVALAFAATSGLSESRAAPFAMMTDFTGTTDRAFYAQFPEVFIGSITAEIGEHNISEAGAALMVPLFAVDVDRTVFGTTSGHVQIAIYNDEFTSQMTADIVAVGGRYLFASDVADVAGVYYAAEGFGVIAVGSDTAADALEAEFRRLREEGYPALPKLKPDPCEEVSGPPTIDVEPNKAKAGQTITVKVTNVPRPEVVIFWRNLRNPIGTARIGKDCTGETVVRVPRKAEPGVYRVFVADARGLKAAERMVVTGHADRKERERASVPERSLHSWLSVVAPGWRRGFK